MLQSCPNAFRQTRACRRNDVLETLGQSSQGPDEFWTKLKSCFHHCGQAIDQRSLLVNLPHSPHLLISLIEFPLINTDRINPPERLVQVTDHPSLELDQHL
jgi:hypothetical protein